MLISYVLGSRQQSFEGLQDQKKDTPLVPIPIGSLMYSSDPS